MATDTTSGISGEISTWNHYLLGELLGLACILLTQHGEEMGKKQVLRIINSHSSTGHR